MSEKLETLKQASKKLEALRPEIREGCLDEADYILQSCGLERTVDILEEAKNVD